ncbi:PREDICTED: dynactin-associated protein [Haliaeetus leucocephalus]|uniref:dynactin-associated protein n=1 Tax=Haliaeetus leucocephalus TaxID=52644 RepID=UPI00053CEDFE|nr:PREDICTED: dynactin-associated protein [Haliaeetus leucocephalus]
MDNQAFEMHGESLQSSSKGEEWPKKEERKGSWSLMKVFLVCLLACIITTTIGVLALSLVYVKNTAFMKETGVTDDGATSPKPDEKSVDIKYQFLNHLGKSKVYNYPGGEIQWARFRKNVNEYQSDEEMEFGKSINKHGSKMTFGTLRIKSKGLRAPHWHFNANEHGYLLQGTAWIGVIGADDSVVTTYNVTAGQVIFFPRNTVHWPQGGVNFIRTFKKQVEDQAINLPPNLNELVQNATYVQSPDKLVWQYFYDLKGSAKYPFPGGIFQWARYRINGTGLNETEKIFSESLNKHENTLTLATLRIFSNGLGQPHFHFNANEMGYVISGCGQAGVILSGVTANFNIGIGDVIFFPVGTQHYIKSLCDEDLLLILAYNTGNQLETLRMNDYFHGTADHILAQLFWKEQAEFKKFPKPAKKSGK